MASASKRISTSSIPSRRSSSPISIRFAAAPNAESEEWLRVWESTTVQALVENPVVAVESEITVEEACDLLLSKGTSCLAVKSADLAPEAARYSGLFDFADVNAFLTFAATQHTYTPEHLQGRPRVAQILEAAKAGHVPVRLVSNLSDKNPLVELPHDASVIALLAVFSTGTHRVLVKSPAGSSESHLGMISDRRLLAYFSAFARSSSGALPPLPSIQPSSSFLRYVSNPLSLLPLPSLNLHSEVVAVHSGNTVLDAMGKMSELGVSSVAVLVEEGGSLLSAVSVTDIGQMVVPSQSNHILTMPIHQFVSEIKMPQGWTDGADRYPVYSMYPSSTLAHTIQKILATNSHRLFVISETPGSASPSSGFRGNLSGVVSIVDVLSLFARIANIPDVDPGRMQRHRRASSASSHGSPSSSWTSLGRSASKGSIGRTGGPKVT
ncbi:hypothetical protein DFH94DRAFT_636020 [Russula ochroleuca]|jgi:CBS domain-containing protein|uniref:CBS domain-containing protein n=1 Tax=Russula ochroleuca TaxID=152965 RepID=A0A9P5MR63_9AGAM|nr:hypothetical protein DFH94DRAFT_636020 [Russula ochroleuca]